MLGELSQLSSTGDQNNTNNNTNDHTSICLSAAILLPCGTTNVRQMQASNQPTNHTAIDRIQSIRQRQATLSILLLSIPSHCLFCLDCLFPSSSSRPFFVCMYVCLTHTNCYYAIFFQPTFSPSKQQSLQQEKEEKTGDAERETVKNPNVNSNSKKMAKSTPKSSKCSETDVANAFALMVSLVWDTFVEK